MRGVGRQRRSGGPDPQRRGGHVGHVPRGRQRLDRCGDQGRQRLRRQGVVGLWRLRLRG
ncbi:hypothetical protein [Ornithinimicrobium kibberense]|uniref:hypothetical protein n=1 Tax=Ornithinimicrobium kibberense TaxID=282060 RepID=UPI0036229231